MTYEDILKWGHDVAGIDYENLKDFDDMKAISEEFKRSARGTTKQNKQFVKAIEIIEDDMIKPDVEKRIEVRDAIREAKTLSELEAIDITLPDRVVSLDSTYGARRSFLEKAEERRSLLLEQSDEDIAYELRYRRTYESVRKTYDLLPEDEDRITDILERKKELIGE